MSLGFKLPPACCEESTPCAAGDLLWTKDTSPGTWEYIYILWATWTLHTHLLPQEDEAPSAVHFSLLWSALYNNWRRSRFSLGILRSPPFALRHLSPEPWQNPHQKHRYPVAIVPQMEVNCSKAESPERITRSTARTTPGSTTWETQLTKHLCAWDQTTTTTSHTLCKQREQWFPRAELQKLKRELKFIARVCGKNYRLDRNTGFPEYHSFSWWVFPCLYPVFTPQRPCLSHLSSSEPFFVPQSCKLSFSFKSFNWWNTADITCLWLACCALSDPRRYSSVPELTPLPRVFRLACKSSRLSASLILLALPDPYSYTPTNTVTAAGCNSYLLKKKSQSVFSLNGAMEGQGGPGGEGPQEVSNPTSSSQPAQLSDGWLLRMLPGSRMSLSFKEGKQRQKSFKEPFCVQLLHNQGVVSV